MRGRLLFHISDPLLLGRHPGQPVLMEPLLLALWIGRNIYVYIHNISILVILPHRGSWSSWNQFSFLYG